MVAVSSSSSSATGLTIITLLLNSRRDFIISCDLKEFEVLEEDKCSGLVSVEKDEDSEGGMSSLDVGGSSSNTIGFSMTVDVSSLDAGGGDEEEEWSRWLSLTRDQYRFFPVWYNLLAHNMHRKVATVPKATSTNGTIIAAIQPKDGGEAKSG